MQRQRTHSAGTLQYRSLHTALVGPAILPAHPCCPRRARASAGHQAGRWSASAPNKRTGIEADWSARTCLCQGPPGNQAKPVCLTSANDADRSLWIHLHGKSGRQYTTLSLSGAADFAVFKSTREARQEVPEHSEKAKVDGSTEGHCHGHPSRTLARSGSQDAATRKAQWPTFSNGDLSSFALHDMAILATMTVMPRIIIQKRARPMKTGDARMLCSIPGPAALARHG